MEQIATYTDGKKVRFQLVQVCTYEGTTPYPSFPSAEGVCVEADGTAAASVTRSKLSLHALSDWGTLSMASLEREAFQAEFRLDKPLSLSSCFANKELLCSGICM
jgi:hypothetical protein